jgi:HEAT repeat protein
MSSLNEIFRQEYFSFQAERDDLASKLWKTVFDPTNKRTLWLLDGLDEISGYRNISGTDLTEVFSSLLSQDNVIITSRPYATNISGLAPFDLELETVGFHPGQVQAYLAKTMKDPDITDQIQAFIQSHWLIQGLVRIPIQLDALCYSWNKNNFHTAPQTITGIYQVMELKLWEKDILNLEKTNNAGRLSETVVQNLRTRGQIQYLAETEMRLLECLAFTGLYSDIIEFHQGHRDWLYEQPQFREMSDDVLDRLSFLRTSDTSSQDQSYHFIHLTFQEYFAAQYFVRCLLSKPTEPLLCRKLNHLRGKYTMKISPEEFLHKNKYHGRYDVFWRFVTGLLHNIDEEQVSSFLEKVEDEPRDLLGPAHQRLLMHCFSELPQLEDSKLAENSNDFLRHLREKMELGCIQWSDHEDKFLREMRLCSETEFPDHVLSKLLVNFLQREGSHRRKILEALAHRLHMSSQVMGITAIFMDDSEWGVRRAAVDALGTQSPWPPEIPQAVMCRLDDSDPDVRLAAVNALGKQSPWPPEILQAVMCRLDDSHPDVRLAAVGALGTQSPWPSEMLQAVMCRLDDSDPDVRSSAVQALGTQSPWPPEILQAVMCLLDDSDPAVKSEAVGALGRQSPWPPEILQAVMCRLDDSDPDVRSEAVRALGKQSPWPPEILQAVMYRLDDSDPVVRWEAVDALGTQSPWPEILQSVTCRLDDSDPVVRRAAVDALGRQSPWPPEILQAVMSRLDNIDPVVRSAAVDALSTQSPWPPEILQAVTCRLDDSNSLVRRTAFEALGTQSPWPPEILQAVTCRLDDSNSLVRRTAFEALGTQSPWPPEILQAVMCRLDDSDPDVRSAAIYALGTQSPWPPETLQAVTCRLDDSNSMVRRVAVDTLGRQPPWLLEILQAVMCRLDDSDPFVRSAAIYALGTRSPWPPEILQAVTCRLDDSDSMVRRAAVDALGRQSPWPPEILQAVMCRLDDSDRTVAAKIEALLWKHDDFVSPLFNLHADAASGLCKLWAQRSIRETFACYVCDGKVYFETSDGRRSMSLSNRKTQLLKHTLRITTVNSPILRLVYRGGNPFKSLIN